MKRILSMLLATALLCSLLTVGASANGKLPTPEEAQKNFCVSARTGATSDCSFWVETPLIVDNAEIEPLQLSGYNAIVKDTPITVRNIGTTDDYTITVCVTQYTHLKDNIYEWWEDYELTNKAGFIPGALDPNVPEYGGMASPAVGKALEFTLPSGGGIILEEGEEDIDIEFYCITVYVEYPKLECYCSFNYYYKHDAQKVAEVLAGCKPATITAAPTASKVLVNGKGTAFDAYTIQGNNYFKIRDVGAALNGTGKQFDVVWDKTLNAVSMASNHPYTAVGGELAKGDGTSKTAKVNTAKVYMDGKEVSLTAYTINGNNYVKLRDLGQLFDFGVRWENAVVIDTSTGYTA